MKELNYQFRQEMAQIHKPGRRDPDKRVADGQVEIDRAWTITVPRDADAVMMNGARDLEDYFFTSMGMSVKVCYEDEAEGKTIAYSTDASLPEYSYRFTVTDDRISLCGNNSRFAAQAGYFAEDLMNLDEAPFLTKQETVRTSLFNPRMIHSGYGLDNFPDEHISAIAHSGISALLVFVKGVDDTPFGYQDFNDLCYRAGRLGVDVYAYSYIPSLFHPDDEGAEEYYEKTYGALFDRCPLFKGVIFVGESIEFASKDPHSAGIRRLDNRGPDGKPLVTGKPHPGWWPCYDYPDWLELMKKVIRKRIPDMDIVFWSYNWCKVDAKYRLELIDALPTDITLQATYEMGEIVERDGIMNRTTDYTLFFEGPGHYFKTEVQRAGERGIKFYSMTNTGGRTWDIGVIPYVPAPYQWMKRYEGMVKAHYEHTFCGTMDSHHYGFYPSFISDLAKWAFHAPAVDLDEVLHKLAARDFSAEYADEVCEAYKCFSEGITHLISTHPDQYGPFRIGPSYPLILFENSNVVMKSPKYAHFGGNTITEPVYHYAEYSGWNEEIEAKYDYERKNFAEVAEWYDKGSEILERIVPTLPERKQRDARRILNLGKFIANCGRTSTNVKDWYKLKKKLQDTHGEERNRIVDEMIEIAKREIENAKNTIPFVEEDSRLGYEPSMEYMCDREHIEWKIALAEEMIKNELPKYYE